MAIVKSILSPPSEPVYEYELRLSQFEMDIIECFLNGSGSDVGSLYAFYYAVRDGNMRLKVKPNPFQLSKTPIVERKT